MARFDFPYGTALDGNGDPKSGDKLFFYEEGTSTKLDSFSDFAQTTANANPAVADSAGRFGEMHLKSQKYKVVWAPAADTDPPTSPIKTWATVGPEALADFFQDIDGSLQSTGSSNAYVVTSNQTVTALAAGIRITFIANHANTGAVTLALDGLVAKTIKKNHDQDLVSGDIEVDQIVDVVYKATEDVWQLLTPTAIHAKVVGRAYSEYTAFTSLSTVIPLNDTIPQNTEGTEILTAAITPNSTSQRIRVRFTGFGSIDSNANLIAALFRDSVAGALQATAVAVEAANLVRGISLEFEEAAPSTSAITYKINIGPSAGIAKMNGPTTARLFGGAARSTLTVELIDP